MGKMYSRLIELFEDKKLVEKIQRRLPYLFQLAELECSRIKRWVDLWKEE
jgi:hypothetical protein